MFRRFAVAAAIMGISFGNIAVASAKTIGQFTEQGDIGSPKVAGSAKYDAAKKQYAVTSGGENMVKAHDEFHFVWRKIKGDFVMRARIAFTGPGLTPHRKAGLMIRNGLSHDAAYVDVAIHGDGPKAMQLRRTAGAESEMLMATPDTGATTVTAPPAGTGTLVQLERHGKRYVIVVARAGEPVVRREVSDIELGDEAEVGFYLCAHNPDQAENATFDNVEIIAAR